MRGVVASNWLKPLPFSGYRYLRPLIVAKLKRLTEKWHQEVQTKRRKTAAVERSCGSSVRCAWYENFRDMETPNVAPFLYLTVTKFKEAIGMHIWEVQFYLPNVHT